jgi:hypothetical protein
MEFPNLEFAIKPLEFALRLLEFGIFLFVICLQALGISPLSINSLLLGSGTALYSKGQCIQPFPQQ